MSQIYLSRRNLITLLSKLDRKAAGQETACTIIKNGTDDERFVQEPSSIMVIAVEDDVYYAQRAPGAIHPLDTPPESP